MCRHMPKVPYGSYAPAMGNSHKNLLVNRTRNPWDKYYFNISIISFQEGGEFLPRGEDGNVLYSDVDFVDTWKALEDCVDEGLVKDIGLSNSNKQQIERILEIARIKPSNNQVMTM